ncbi:MAG: 16S rRNA (uracil(1498)-N(3))-methyltransferase [Alphaproteobacteria bacterium]|nr:MAG: 16S rRNA (uracil(1498)-N(3))-methyltransferase [Alphaproteobacteria bacterium]
MSSPDATFDFAKIRLFVGADMSEGALIQFDKGQVHYLVHVMRQKAGDTVLVFNGRDGEWLAALETVGKREVTARLVRPMRAQAEVPDVMLVFAVLKKTPMDFLVQKAVELGAAILQPVVTEYTNQGRVNEERMRAQAIEAAEQSGRLSLPDIRPLARLADLLDQWPGERSLLFCDEAGGVPALREVLEEGQGSAPAALLIGPEGGFSEGERARLRGFDGAVAVGLGPRIMRAETAAMAALTIWQSVNGDL